MTNYTIVSDILQPVRANELTAQAIMTQIERADRIINRYSGRPSGAKMINDTLAELERYEQQLNACLDVLCGIRERALKYINTLDGEEYAIIYRYFIKGEKKWEDIALSTFMSERRVFLLRKSALAKLEAAYQNDKKEAIK